LKKAGKFEWIDEANNAFEKLKAYLTSSLILTPPTKREDMLLYIAATTTMVSAAIIVEREEEGHVFKVQRPVYYVSEVLSDSKI
jgi:transcription-repair coupling factor (superfamily II helicase)